MSDPKRHHYVPQVLLENFTDSDGWLHICNKSSLKAYRTRCDKAFVRKHYYSETDSFGSRDSKMELYLAEIEGKIAPVLSKLIRSSKSSENPRLNSNEKALWDKFLLLQYRRVPDLRDAKSKKNALKNYEQITNRLKLKFPAKVSEIEKFETDSEKLRMIDNAYVKMLELRFGKAEKVLASRGIILLKSAQKKQFIIGSRPVIQMNMGDGKTLVDNFSEMWLPISSSLTVGVGTQWEKEKILELGHTGMRYFNEAIARNSSEFASASSKLTASLMSAVTIN